MEAKGGDECEVLMEIRLPLACHVVLRSEPRPVSDNTRGLYIAWNSILLKFIKIKYFSFSVIPDRFKTRLVSMALLYLHVQHSSSLGLGFISCVSQVPC